MPPSVRASIYRGTPRNLAQLARVLQRGDLVAVPSETVYGLAADALNARACEKIFRAKGRPSNDPLIVHIHHLAQLDPLAVRNEAVDLLAAKFWPGPLTLVLPKKPCVPAIVTAGLPSVALRMPSHPLFRKLLRVCGLPLAAPSANPFGYISPTTAQHVKDSLGAKIRFILDGGPSTIGLESTILDLRNPRRPMLLRPGAIARAELEAVLGRRVFMGPRQSPGSDMAAVAPGLLSRHYSPRTPLVLHTRLQTTAVTPVAAGELFLFQRRPNPPTGRTLAPNIYWLSATGSLSESAQALFARLRDLDRSGQKRIHAELAPGKSALALAINDRLIRAASKGGGKNPKRQSAKITKK